MMFANLSDELNEVLTDVFSIDESTQSIPTFDRESVEKIFWKLTSFDEASAKKLAEELSIFVSNLKRSDDQVLVTAVIQRPAARITESDITLIAKLDKTERMFHRLLDQDERSPKVDMGLVLFSAVRYGGLLDKHNIEHLFHKMRRGEPPTIIGKTAWYTFEHDVGGKFIWLPEPLTLGLITQWCSQRKAEAMRQQSSKRYGWHHYVNELIRAESAEKVKWTPMAFLKASSIRLAMDIAPALVDVASGKTQVCAFHQHTWLRLLTEKSPTLAKEYKQREIPLDVTKSSSFDFLQSSFDTEILKRVSKISGQFKGRPIQHTIDAINDVHSVFAARISPNLNLLFEWMLFRVVNAGSWSGPLKISSAINRLGVLHRAFRTHEKVDDVLLLDAQETSEFYEAVISAYQNERQVTVARALRDFHDFLTRNHGVEPDYTPDKYILKKGKKNKALSVDAEVLMPWEYSQLKSYLTRVVASSSHQDIARLVLATLILGYRAGFRRSEIHYLRVNDFSIWDEKPEVTEVIVKEHQLRTLKSPSAYRRIKIGVLLSPPERKFLLDLVKERKLRDGIEAFVFRTLDCERPFVSAKQLFEPLVQLLKQVTGNPDMRFHHLRHSVATWNFWRWMAPSSGQHSAIPTLAKMVSFEQIAAERQAIIGVREGLAPSRRTLHALSMMIGHSHPTTTLRHYIHSTHVTLHDQLCLVQPRLKKKVLAKLAGVTTRGLLKSMKNKAVVAGEPQLDEWKAVAVRDKCVQTLRTLQDKNLTQKDWRKKAAFNLTWHDREPSGERSELIDYYLAAKDYYEGTESIECLEKRYAIFGTTLKKVLEQSSELFKLQTRVRKGNSTIPRQRHWERFSVERLNYATGEIYYESDYYQRLPSLPRQIRERITVERMLVATQSLNKTQKSKLINALDYFVNNSNRRDNGISFTTRRSLDAFVTAIRLLQLTVAGRDGQHNERLRITINAPELNTLRGKKRALVDYWNKKIGFKRYQIVFRERSLGSKYKHGQVNLDLMAVEAKTSATVSDRRRIADAGFRVGLYVLYVTRSVWHF